MVDRESLRFIITVSEVIYTSNRKQILLLYFIMSLTLIAVTILGTLTSSYAQDLNPPTTGTTTLNVTSRFGTNNTAPNSNVTNGGQNVAK